MSTFLLLILAALLGTSSARIHSLSISEDDRAIFPIESFGFASGGRAQISVHNFQVRHPRTRSPGVRVAEGRCLCTSLRAQLQGGDSAGGEAPVLGFLLRKVRAFRSRPPVLAG